jgi:hypothetical protein
LGGVQHSKRVQVLNHVQKLYMLMTTKHSQQIMCA